MPRFWGTEPTSTLPWLAVVGIPLLTAAGAVAYVQRISLRDLGLRLLRGRGALVQAGIAAPRIEKIVPSLEDVFIARVNS